MRMIGAADVAGKLTWTAVVAAIREGHERPKARLGDQFLYQGENTLLSRAAWIDGLGVGVKSCTVKPGNAAAGLPSIHGMLVVFEDDHGQPIAAIDNAVITNWKTSGDSVLGATLLARPDSKRLTILGAGTVAENLVRAYSEMFPGLEAIQVWNRTPARAEALAAKMAGAGAPIAVATDLADAVASADIVAAGTMANEPILRGEWVTPGTHVDLIGAFTHDMREADDALLRKGRIFVDSRETTIEHIGELKIPIAAGVIGPEAVVGDYYDLIADGAPGRVSADEITVFKNGGGAHLDLMTAQAILAAA